MPAPLNQPVVGTFAPGQRREDLLAGFSFGTGYIEAVEHHQWLALTIAVAPDLGGRTMLPMLARTLRHCLVGNWQHGQPFSCSLLFPRGALDAHASVNAQELDKFLASLYIASTVDVSYQVDQIAALVAGGEVGPRAFTQADFQRPCMLVVAGRIGGGVFLATIDTFSVGQPMGQYGVDVLQSGNFDLRKGRTPSIRFGRAHTSPAWAR
ncbi:hypothetical protein D3C77_404780 [compost metagenome]